MYFLADLGTTPEPINVPSSPAFPWILLVIILMIVAFAVLGAWRLRKRARVRFR